ncbi:MAG: N-formylglutamate deformylase [Proteobacteria bacterium]|nr:N-formylglutamate deformylase [Pseudomonadota bacterium]
MTHTAQTFPTHTVTLGASPLVISVPHGGTALPADLAAELTPLALTVPDTDWHVGKLYAFAATLGASMIMARQSRYLIDLNRPPDDAALYTTSPQTGLCPALSFAGEPLYRDGRTAVPAAEVARRRAQYWEPYHRELRALLDAARAKHGYALLLDAHSIRSVVPRLFDGKLPDINVGTNDGRSCAPRVSAALRPLLAATTRWSHVFDGRFKGGHITRHYGQPAHDVHALQIELAQCSYMDESGTSYDAARAAPLQELLRQLLTALLALRFDPA